MGSKKEKILSVVEVARMMGISRTQVLRKINKGEIQAQRVGRAYIIPASGLTGIYRPLSDQDKKDVETAVEKTLKEYGEVIRKLANT